MLRMGYKNKQIRSFQECYKRAKRSSPFKFISTQSFLTNSEVKKTYDYKFISVTTEHKMYKLATFRYKESMNTCLDTLL